MPERIRLGALAAPQVQAIPARDFGNAAVLGQVPGLIVPDDRPGAPPGYFYWAVDAGQVGQVLHAYRSTWLSQRLLDPERLPALAGALTRASQIWPVALHCNKGLAEAPDNALNWAKDTAMNPAVLDSFALAIAGANEPPAYPGIPGHEPNVAKGRQDARAVTSAMAPAPRATTPASARLGRPSGHKLSRPPMPHGLSAGPNGYEARRDAKPIQRRLAACLRTHKRGQESARPSAAMSASPVRRRSNRSNTANSWW